MKIRCYLAFGFRFQTGWHWADESKGVWRPQDNGVLQGELLRAEQHRQNVHQRSRAAESLAA